MTIKLSDLTATEQAMSAAPWRWRSDEEAVEDDADQLVFFAAPCGYENSSIIGCATDKAGLIAARNALPVLLECVRTELEMDAAGKRAAKARFAWSRAYGAGDPSEAPLIDEVERAERLYFAAKTAHEAALAKVAP